LKYLKYWFPVIVYSGIIFYASSIPGVKTPGFAHFDKIVHICEYAPLGFFAARAVYFSKPGVSLNSVILYAVLFVLLFGISDETHQMFVVNRTSSLLDILADFIGGSLGCLVYGRLRLIR